MAWEAADSRRPGHRIFLSKALGFWLRLACMVHSFHHDQVVETTSSQEARPCPTVAQLLQPCTKLHKTCRSSLPSWPSFGSFSSYSSLEDHALAESQDISVPHCAFTSCSQTIMASSRECGWRGSD